MVSLRFPYHFYGAARFRHLGCLSYAVDEAAREHVAGPRVGHAIACLRWCGFGQLLANAKDSFSSVLPALRSQTISLYAALLLCGGCTVLLLGVGNRAAVVPGQRARRPPLRRRPARCRSRV